MPVQGSLATMSLTEILQWLGNAGKTGTLSIERNKVVKRILVREGRIIACSSQEPSDMLGHFLVSRGKITEETLRKALAVQETQRTHLGRILVESGALSEDDLRLLLEDKAQETIFGLFDWDDAEFRFADDEAAAPNIFAVDMRVEDILLRGAQRWDEMQRFRTVFNDPGIVLGRTTRMPPAEVFRNRMARRIFESINGERTVAEILLHAHGSEYLVTKFLYELHRAGVAEITGVKTVAREPSPEPVPLRRPRPPHRPRRRLVRRPSARDRRPCAPYPLPKRRRFPKRPPAGPGAAGPRPRRLRSTRMTSSSRDAYSIVANSTPHSRSSTAPIKRNPETNRYDASSPRPRRRSSRRPTGTSFRRRKSSRSRGLSNRSRPSNSLPPNSSSSVASMALGMSSRSFRSRPCARSMSFARSSGCARRD